MGWGAGLDIHKAILKVAPKKGFVMPGHHYTGPGNPLEQQLKYNPDTGQILEIYQQLDNGDMLLQGTLSQLRQNWVWVLKSQKT